MLLVRRQKPKENGGVQTPCEHCGPSHRLTWRGGGVYVIRQSWRRKWFCSDRTEPICPTKASTSTLTIYKGGLKHFLLPTLTHSPQWIKFFIMYFSYSGCYFNFLRFLAHCWRYVWSFTTQLADSGIPTSSQSPLRPGFPSYMTCVTGTVILVNCRFTHVCHGGSASQLCTNWECFAPLLVVVTKGLVRPGLRSWA